MRRRRRLAAAPGFTLIELMVVVAIVVMAMGIMAPTLIEFFKNQKLKSVRTHFSSAFNVARLLAINDGAPVRVVFFHEGVRVYNTAKKAFRADEDFNAESAPGSVKGITINLRFANRKNDDPDVVPYRDWETLQPHLREIPGLPDSSPQAGQCDVSKLIAIEFQRDGTVLWIKGDDIPTAAFNRDPPDADIIVTQLGNPDGLFIDIRNTGPIKTEFKKLPESMIPSEI